MSISSFDDLLCAAREQSEPQRLLFVFAGAVLPDDSTPEQRARFDAGQGGALAPLMSVDKTPEELSTFAALVEESRQFARDWAIVFVASLPGHDGRAPTSAEADRPLQRMIESIEIGLFASFIPFDRQGQPILLD
ncbi:MAG TPA: ribonucleotide reductase subunit alpha [Burkholderiales bacterium]|nr:ribonucleotide reductase subunit alpha [Burkholderiales bacterium]